MVCNLGSQEEEGERGGEQGGRREGGEEGARVVGGRRRGRAGLWSSSPPSTSRLK
jgi:hypothetical protein